MGRLCIYFDMVRSALGHRCVALGFPFLVSSINNTLLFKPRTMKANRHLLFIIILLLCLKVKIYLPLTNLELGILILIGLLMALFIVDSIKEQSK